MLGESIPHTFLTWGKVASRPLLESSVREDLISSETFCTRSEASISHLDVEGHESLACALPMVAHTKQVPDSKPRASQKISVPIRAVSIFTLPETLSTGKKKIR